jgi:mercuric ion binding protein
MRKSLTVATVAVTAVLLSWSAQAADKTIVLDVRNADCVLCPPIVRQSLMRVPGVKNVKTSQANQMADFMATITFDDAVTNEAALIAATTKAGYPSHVASAN